MCSKKGVFMDIQNVGFNGFLSTFKTNNLVRKDGDVIENKG